MKLKILSIVCLSTLLLCLIGCQKEELGNDMTAITLSIPEEMMQRIPSPKSNGDSWTAMKVNYYIYKSTDGGTTYPATPIKSGTLDFNTTTNKATLALHLANNFTYEMVFYAYCGSYGPFTTPYSYDSATRTVTMTYTNDRYRGNLEELDIFAKRIVQTITSSTSVSVKLDRIVCQVNVLTGNTDYANCLPVYKPLGLTMEVSNVYPSFNIRNWTATGTPKTITFENGVITDNLLTNGGRPNIKVGSETAKAKWLGMNYFFTTTTNVNITAYIKDEINTSAVTRVTVEAPNVPVQTNHRTNLYGDLLTGTATINVSKDSVWNGMKYNQVGPTPISNIAELKNALNNGGIYYLKNNISGSSTLEVNAATYLDLNGHSIIMGTGTYQIDINESCTLTNGTISVSKGATYGIKINDGNDVIFNDLTIDVPNANSNAGIVYFNTSFNREATINSCTINGKGAPALYLCANGTYNINNTILNSNNRTLFITGGISTPMAPIVNLSHCTMNSTLESVYVGMYSTSNAPTCNAIVSLYNCTATTTGTNAACIGNYGQNGRITINGGTYTGNKHSLIARTGTTIATDAIFIATGIASSDDNDYISTDWGATYNVPKSVVTIGNRNTSIYSSLPASVTLTRCKVKSTSGYANTKMVYIYANSGSGNGVTFNDPGTIFDNDNIVYGSSNITVNGVDQ